jgi:phosphoglycolate phosphatase
MSAIIFDFDGTIADSFDLVLDLFYQLTNHPTFTASEIAEYKKLTFARALRKVKLPPRQIPFLLIKGRKIMASRLHEVKPFPGMKSALKGLHERGFQLLVISSNSNHNVETFLQDHGLHEYIDKVYGGIGLFSKAGALRKVMRQNKLKPVQCVYVGDEVRDIVAAKHARVRAAAVAWGYNDVSILKAHNPYFIIKIPADLAHVKAAE